MKTNYKLKKDILLLKKGAILLLNILLKCIDIEFYQTDFHLIIVYYD